MLLLAFVVTLAKAGSHMSLVMMPKGPRVDEMDGLNS
jgi:hypothetical protein